ncbi:hypothetical protein H0H81_011515 [Sphagnurus paluster]|uniref:Protein kinase domain-containing protein n=1 Tax=Sphagnurus paluster TaxID=117069 RepID=A0A9P7K3G9_9AGAR|nr:hypothetical protein H0H81_011515 [Sphagnurus paluster]
MEDNILVDASSRAYIDLGVSLLQDTIATAWESKSTVVGASRLDGTLRWLAPELLDPNGSTETLGSAKESKASDVYAWSSTCYEIFTGKVPFYELAKYQALLATVNGQKPRRPTKSESWGLTDTIWQLMTVCWNKNPHQRPTIHDTLIQLQRIEHNDYRAGRSWQNVYELRTEHLNATLALTLEHLDDIFLGKISNDHVILGDLNHPEVTIKFSRARSPHRPGTPTSRANSPILRKAGFAKGRAVQSFKNLLSRVIPAKDYIESDVIIAITGGSVEQKQEFIKTAVDMASDANTKISFRGAVQRVIITRPHIERRLIVLFNCAHKIEDFCGTLQDIGRRTNTSYPKLSGLIHLYNNSALPSLNENLLDAIHLVDEYLKSQKIILATKDQKGPTSRGCKQFRTRLQELLGHPIPAYGLPDAGDGGLVGDDLRTPWELLEIISTQGDWKIDEDGDGDQFLRDDIVIP